MNKLRKGNFKVRISSKNKKKFVNEPKPTIVKNNFKLKNYVIVVH